jgi:beta-galactosidase
MSAVLFNDNWVFLKTALDVSLSEVQANRSAFSPVCLPHDWAIADVEHLYEDSCGWYAKLVSYDKSRRGDRKVFLRFDGVYMDCSVYVNGQLAGEWKYGYTTFAVEISKFLQDGENELIVQVRYQNPNSRWYSGAGIYRNVWWKECEEAYLPFDSTYVTTEYIPPHSSAKRVPKEGRGDFFVNIETQIEGTPESLKDAYCIYTLEQNGEWLMTLAHSPIWEKNGIYFNIARPRLLNMLLWDIDQPACYQIRAELYGGENSHLMDSQVTTIGFRQVRWEPNTGLWLNDRPLKLHGVCEHHDLGCLGAAFSKKAMRRKFRLLREMGVNAIRTSHNMPAPEVMDLADEMGFLVVNEAFDMWEYAKTQYDYARYFKEWAKRDVTNWVRRDRNHPSLLLWSIGNEIYDTHADAHGLEITKQLAKWVRLEDKNGHGRITLGSNYMAWENTQTCADYLKMAGYNYGENLYDEQHERHPDWIIYGSETASVTQSRGVYHFPLSQSTLADEDEQCSSLGNSSTSWGAPSIRICIEEDLKRSYCAGQFVWTGFDYIGEPTPYQTKNSYFGQLDTAGFPKDAYYLFKAAWTDGSKHPMIHLFPYWDFNEGQMIDVIACTNGDSVELFCNGQSYGRQGNKKYPWQIVCGVWRIPYHKGTIKALAYDQQSFWFAEATQVTPGEPKNLTITQEKYETTFVPQVPKHKPSAYQKKHTDKVSTTLCAPALYADGEDICFLHIGVTDDEGTVVPNGENYVQVSVSGAGVLLGLDNGDSTDYDAYQGGVRKLFKGKLLAMIGTTTQPGNILVTVTGEGLTPAVCTIRSLEKAHRLGIGNRRGVPMMELPQVHPLRKITLEVGEPKLPLRTAEGILLLNQDQPKLSIKATISPQNADIKELSWKAVNQKGIEVGYVSCTAWEEPLDIADQETNLDLNNTRVINLEAAGDGDFRLRCVAKGGKWGTVSYSELEVHAEGFGKPFLNPYEFISGGLYTDSIGELGVGNDKGIATSRLGRSGAVYASLDFGEYGSDTLTLSVFALDDDPYPIEIWQGKPGEKDSEMLTEVIYQKPSQWNVYQEETYTLPKKTKGIATISFVLRQKVHIKGFYFHQESKAYARLKAAECSSIYGDSYVKEKEAITSIGNNVSIEFEQMDFGEAGADTLTIWGRTPLQQNSIQVLFTKEAGETCKFGFGVDFMNSPIGGESTASEYQAQQFSIQKITGKGKITFIFLPGSHFDFHSFQFQMSSCELV